MKVLLLAAGRSKRMKPIEDKNFLNFMGKTLIEWQIGLLRECGLNEIVIVGGAHNLEQLGELGCEVVEQKDLDAGMCGAVLAASDILDGEVLIVSSNDMVEKHAFNLMLEAASGGAESYLLGKKVDEYFPGGYLETGVDGEIMGIIEKPGAGNEPSDLVNLVVHLHKDFGKLVKYMGRMVQEGEKGAHSVRTPSDDKYEVALDNMIKDGVRMEAVEYDGIWQPVKFPWHVMKVFRALFEGMGPKISEGAEVAEGACVKGDVIIEEGARIFDGAHVIGPAYIGKGSIVATNALVRDSHVGDGCVIGFSTEVARSYLGSAVWTHSNYIGDSVIGNNVSFGAGTVTGNLRLDEANIEVDGVDTGDNKFGLVTGDRVRAGINTSFMPGVRIGSDSFIGAGIVVVEDVPENSFVRGKWELRISENKQRAGTRDDLKKKL